MRYVILLLLLGFAGSAYAGSNCTTTCNTNRLTGQQTCNTQCW